VVTAVLTHPKMETAAAPLQTMHFDTSLRPPAKGRLGTRATNSAAVEVSTAAQTVDGPEMTHAMARGLK
jgi:hypothetical protein